MKLAKSRLNTQRRHLESKLAHWQAVRPLGRPPSGWVKAIRESLGMTARQLGQYLGMSSPAVTKLEARERDRSITLRDLDRAAQVLGCRLVYALVPEDTLEQTLERQSRKAALRLTRKAEHHMKLEAQGVEPAETHAQMRVLAQMLRERLDSRLWEKEDPHA
jgi:predicted DNA-binding mobile mystery protein A